MCKENLRTELVDLFAELKGTYAWTLLDEAYYVKLFKERKLYIYGAGNTAKNLVERVPYLNIEAIVVTQKESDEIEFSDGKRYKIISIDEMNKDIYCIVASIYYVEICGELEKRGFLEGKNFISYRFLLPTPSEMIRKLLEAKEPSSWKCNYYEKTVRLQRDGSVGFCMNTPWLNPPNGNVFLQDYNEIVNSIRSKIIKFANDRGYYLFCNSVRCCHIRDDNEHYCDYAEDKDISSAIAAFDRTCNLKCESCRSQQIKYDDERTEYLKAAFESLLEKYDIINLAGEGEALYSKAYLDILEKCKNKAILILSNGNLATKEKVNWLVELSNNKLSFSISVDAAYKETYEKLRINGNYDKVVDNLKYIGELIDKGNVVDLMLNFVISKKNYGEIAEFVELGKRVGATGICFTMIGNWGTFSNEEFEKIRVSDTKGEPIEELKQLMKKLKYENEDINIFFTEEYDARTYLSMRLIEKLEHEKELTIIGCKDGDDF